MTIQEMILREVVDSDDVPEGTENKYDTGVPPATIEDLPDGATRKAMLAAEKTKLTGVEDGAKDDQNGAEIRDLIVGLADTERKLLITDPGSGEHKVVSAQRLADGTIKVKFDDVAES